MSNADELMARALRGDDAAALRLDVAEFLRGRIEALGPGLDAWQKTHLAQAISAIACNLQQGQRESTTWLRLSIVNALQADVPVESRNESNLDEDAVSWITQDVLLSVLNDLGLTAP